MTDREQLVSAFRAFNDQDSWRQKIGVWAREIPRLLRKSMNREGYDYAVYHDYSSRTINRIGTELLSELYKQGFRRKVVVGSHTLKPKWHTYVDLINTSRAATGGGRQIKYNYDMTGWAVSMDLPEESESPRHKSRQRKINPESEIMPSAEYMEAMEQFSEKPPAEDGYLFIIVFADKNIRNFKNATVLAGVKNKGNDDVNDVGEARVADVLRTPNWFDRRHARHTADRIRAIVPNFRATAELILETAVGLRSVMPKMAARRRNIAVSGAAMQDPAVGD